MVGVSYIVIARVRMKTEAKIVSLCHSGQTLNSNDLTCQIRDDRKRVCTPPPPAAPKLYTGGGGGEIPGV